MTVLAWAIRSASGAGPRAFSGFPGETSHQKTGDCAGLEGDVVARKEGLDAVIGGQVLDPGDRAARVGLGLLQIGEEPPRPGPDIALVKALQLAEPQPTLDNQQRHQLAQRRDMVLRFRHFLAEELGLPCAFHFERRAGVKPDNEAVRQAIREATPLVLFGSYNERMYLSEAGGRAVYIPASLPGTIIRRHTGTPFMGYSGATYLIQEVCNALFDALYNILPLGTQMDEGDATPARLQRELPWDADAQQALDRALEAVPMLVRISTAKRLRDAAERAAREAGQQSVTVAQVRMAQKQMATGDAA